MKLLSWDKILTQAVEDAKSYLQMILLWPEQSEDYSQSYIFISALSNRARIRYVLTLIEAKDFPSEYKEYKDQLTALWSQAENMLKEDIFSDGDQVIKILSNEFPVRLKGIEDDLRKVRHLAQDGDLTGDYDWIHEDMVETAQDFLLCFQDMAFTNAELAISPFADSYEYKKFQQEFKSVEDLFNKYFGYFHLVRDLLSSIKEREYNAAFWWLKKVPDADATVEENISNAVIDKLRGIFESIENNTVGECPDEETVIAYALGVLSSNERVKIREHVHKCRTCFKLITDIRYTEALANESKLGKDKATNKILDKILKNLLKKEESKLSLLAFINNFCVDYQKLIKEVGMAFALTAITQKWLKKQERLILHQEAAYRGKQKIGKVNYFYGKKPIAHTVPIPDNIKYFSILQIRLQKNDILIYCDNSEVESRPLILSPKLTKEDIGNNQFYLLLSMEKLDIRKDELIITSDRFIDIISEVSSKQGFIHIFEIEAKDNFK